MKIARLWFVALIVVALLRSEPFWTVEPAPRTIPSCSMWIELNETEPEAAPPMPEPGPWLSLIDQTTGTFAGVDQAADNARWNWQLAQLRREASPGAGTISPIAGPCTELVAESSDGPANSSHLGRGGVR